MEFDIIFFNNENLYEEFAVDKQYGGLVGKCLAISFHVGLDCYKDYMVLVHA